VPALKRFARYGGERGKIINIVSWASLDASPFVGFYAAAKAALLRLTQAQFFELDRFDIDAIAIVPGRLKTPEPAPSKIAKLIFAISRKRRPRYEHDLGFDTKLVQFLNRWLPFRLLRAMKRSLLGLNVPTIPASATRS
jgi:NAD(P)-dependent dehydrogenase (short-subunit alcohol dehydrogenase family)